MNGGTWRLAAPATARYRPWLAGGAAVARCGASGQDEVPVVLQVRLGGGVGAGEPGGAEERRQAGRDGALRAVDHLRHQVDEGGVKAGVDRRLLGGRERGG